MDILGQSSGLVNAATAFSGGLGTSIAGVSLPAPNILSNYASYDYVISLSPLTYNDFNFPDTSYKAGKVLPLVCKTAGADPENRIQTNFGKHDFFLDNLTFETLIGYQSSKATNVSTVQFDVYEPYSIGLFMNALQYAAVGSGFDNWREAPFLLTIEFRGNKETGLMTKVPFSARHIPITLTTVNIKANEQGCRYMINAFATQGAALTSEFAKLKTDATIKGKTVQEVLQTGEQSLQNVVNRLLQEYVTRGEVKVADQIVILFPKEEDMPSSGPMATVAADTVTVNKATINPQVTPQSTELYKKIGVNATTLQQSASSVNALGAASLGYSYKRKGDAAPGNENDTWDPFTESWIRGKLVSNINEGVFKFNQDMDIPTVINQILLTSSYAEKALAANNIDPATGMRTWWRIDTQTFFVDSKENLAKTGKSPRINVYKVIPFKVHPSKVGVVNTNVDGIDKIKKQTVKRYDYLFTGKNTEVISFDIDYSIGFANALAADGYKKSIDVALGKKNATGDDNKKADLAANQTGEKPEKKSGSQPTQVTLGNTGTSFSNKGGGGQDTEVQLAGRIFHDAITNPVDMINLELEIIGDPYWIANSGMGNYVAKSVPGVKDLHKDGSVNWQTSEVDVTVNFRTPIDINNITGMYDFRGANHTDMTKDPKAGPAVGFTGNYCINTVTNYFRQGTFRQKLKGFRRSNQEKQKVVPASKSVNTSTPAESSGKK